MNNIRVLKDYLKGYNFLSLTPIILFIISPIASLFAIMFEMKKNKQSAYTMFAIFVALLAYMLAPVSDLASSAWIYLDDKTMSWNQLVKYQFNGGDFIMQLSEWLIAQIGIPFAYFRLLETLIAFLILNSMFFYKINHSPIIYNPSEIFFRYALLFLIFPFILMVGGVRYGFGVVVMLLGFHYYIDRNKKTASLFLLLIASFIHFSLLYFSLFILIILQLKFNRKVACLLLICAFAVSLPLQTQIQTYMEANEMQGRGYLGDGVWGRQVGFELGINAIIYHWGQRICLLPIIFAFFKRYNADNKWSRVWFSFLIIASCTYSAFTLIQRITVCLTTCSVLFIISLEEFGHFSSRFRKWLLVCAFIICFFDLYTHREQLILSQYWRLVLPSVYTLSNDYDKNWLLENAFDRSI